MCFLANDDLIFLVAISEEWQEFVDEVLEYVIDVDLLGHLLGKLVDESLIYLVLKRIHLIVRPEKLEEVFYLGNHIFVHGLSSVVLG